MWMDSDMQDRLKVLRDVAAANGSEESAKRLSRLNKHASKRELKVGDKVMLKVPGLQGALEAAWEGPYEGEQKLSKVNYRIKRIGGSGSRVVHINKTKSVVDRCKAVNSVAVIAEEDVEMERMWSERKCLGEEVCEGFVQEELDCVLKEVEQHFSDLPGKCKVGKCKIVVKKDAEVVNLPPRQIPFRIREQVEKENRKCLSLVLLYPVNQSGVVQWFRSESLMVQCVFVWTIGN